VTFVARLTPPGSAAIATLALHGPDAWEAARRRFVPRRGELPAVPPAGRSWLGRVRTDDGSPGDEVILAVPGDPDTVELHCHGGRVVVDWLLELFQKDGLTVVGWADLLPHQCRDPLRAAAVEAIAHAPTLRTAGVLLDQHDGALAAALSDVTADRLDAVLRYAGVGAHLVEPWKVVVAGPPNAGKSSLVNAIAGHERCVVAAVPGTTRDVVTTLVAIDGWPVELTDTAGLRDAADDLERAGVELAAGELAAADLVLWVSAPDVPPLPPPSVVPLLPVFAKCDLPGDAPADAVRVSAKTGEGLDALLAAVAARLVPDAPPPGVAVPFTTAQVEALTAARGAVVAGDVGAARAALERLSKRA
jgi:tRNA modification GTPase